MMFKVIPTLAFTSREPCLEAKNETINIDPAELSDARWMSEERNRNGGVGGFDGLTAVLESLDRSGHQEDFIQV